MPRASGAKPWRPSTPSAAAAGSRSWWGAPASTCARCSRAFTPRHPPIRRYAGSSRPRWPPTVRKRCTGAWPLATRVRPHACIRAITCASCAPSRWTCWARAVPPFRLLMVGLRQPRETLNRRIADRVRAMVAHGMMREVRQLLAAGYDDTLPAMGGIGYRQFVAVLRGTMTEADAVRLMIRDTTRYAKRQMTWFARDREIRWLDVDAAGGVESAARTVFELVEKEELIR